MAQTPRSRGPLAETEYHRVSSRVLDIANRLRELGVDQVLKVPTLVIAGDQSSGKSSVVEAIAGVSLPRSGGTCTRCPTEVRMRWVPACLSIQGHLVKGSEAHNVFKWLSRRGLPFVRRRFARGAHMHILSACGGGFLPAVVSPRRTQPQVADDTAAGAATSAGASGGGGAAAAGTADTHGGEWRARVKLARDFDENGVPLTEKPAEETFCVVNDRSHIAACVAAAQTVLLNPVTVSKTIGGSRAFVPDMSGPAPADATVMQGLRDPSKFERLFTANKVRYARHVL
jgi:hypothetical protein